MKGTKQVIVLVILVIVLGGIVIYPSLFSDSVKTIEEAVEKSGRDVVKVIHEERVNDGVVVFFYKGINGGSKHTMAAGFVKKTFGGWEWVYGGEHSEPGLPITAQYFPHTGDASLDTPFPLAFGEITNPKIVKIKLQTENWKGQKEARIVENGTTKIWYTFLSRSEGYLTKVVGYSESGEIIDSRDFGENPTVTKIEL